MDKTKKGLVDIVMNAEAKYRINPEHRLVAYFCMGMGINPKMPTYSGGLEVLAGDHIKAAADMELPLVAVTLLHRKGYFKQEIGEDGRQFERYPKWSPEEFMELHDSPGKIVNLRVNGDDVKIRAWQYNQIGQSGYKIPILFLDTDIEGNSVVARDFTSYLYGSDNKYRLSQEAVLGLGGAKILENLGYNKIEKFHMNEGHAALLPLYLLKKEEGDVEKVKKKVIFTTHTPVPAGHDKFEVSLVSEVLHDQLSDITPYCEDGKLNMTHVALKLSNFTNGVSKKHAEVSRVMFPKYKIDSITNGVHAESKVTRHTKKLFDEHLRGWSLRPDRALPYVFKIPDEEIIMMHRANKKDLMDFVNTMNPQANFSTDALTLTYARRFAEYKRATLLLSNIEKLVEIAGDKERPIQLIFSGKAHPQDEKGKQLIQEIIKTADDLSGIVKISFLPNYNMDIAKLLTSGSDFWLNTPRRPYEASGTSGMKALLNGVINISIDDGWVCEGIRDGVNGIIIGDKAGKFNLDNKDEARIDAQDAADLYNKLENVVKPMYYDDKKKLVDMMKSSIAVGSYFTTARMVREYRELAYEMPPRHQDRIVLFRDVMTEN